jgi:hypothetical protein
MQSDLGIALQGDKQARSVFHQVLLRYLVRWGASSLAQINRRPPHLFSLRFHPKETEDIIESARREGLVEPLYHPRDAYERDVTQTEWMPTARGRELKRPHGLTPTDFKTSLVDSLPVGGKVVTGLFGLAGLVLTLPVLGALFNTHSAHPAKTVSPQAGSVATDIRPVVIAAAGGLVFLLGVMLLRGFNGDSDLRHAAKVWARLGTSRSEFVAWQTSKARPLFGIAAALLFLAAFGLSLLVHVPGWLGGLLYGLAVGICIELRRRTNEARQDIPKTHEAAPAA